MKKNVNTNIPKRLSAHSGFGPDRLINCTKENLCSDKRSIIIISYITSLWVQTLPQYKSNFNLD